MPISPPTRNRLRLARRSFLRLAGTALLTATDLAQGAAGHDRTTTAAQIWTSYYSGTRVWGYTNKHSVRPGEPFDLMLSTGPDVKAAKGRIEIFRIGYYPEGDRHSVWSAEGVEVPQQEIQVTASAIGAGWSPAVGGIDTDGWKPGYYTIDFIDDMDGQRDLNVAYIVVTAGGSFGDIVVILSTNTYQAYNKWGGYSFYSSAFLGDRSQIISFDRPCECDFFEYEYWFVLWVERFALENGIRVDYATNFDIHSNPALSQGCKLLISGSHNEYWSKEEFDAVYGRIFQLGKNTLFLGANAAYWQVRYADVNGLGGSASQGRQLICFKSTDDPIRNQVDDKEAMLLVTARFRDFARRPESMLMGVAYQGWFDPASGAKYPFFVEQDKLPFFTGTGYQQGEAIGDLVGYEWDNTDPEGDGKRLWDPQRSQIAPIDPARIHVVFKGYPVDVEGKPGRAEAVYFTSEAGAKVFSTGSVRWAWGLGKPGFEQEKFKIFNRNLLTHLLDL